MGWGAIVLSLTKMIRGDLSYQQLFDLPSFRMHVQREYERILQKIEMRFSLLPLQFPTFSDSMSKTYRLLLRDMNEFASLFETVKERKQYHLEITPFGAARPANINQNNGRNIHISDQEQSQKQRQCATFCQQALIPILPWWVDEKTADKESSQEDVKAYSQETDKRAPLLSLITLLNEAEYKQLTQRIHQLGAMVGVMGLALKLSSPMPCRRIFLEQNKQRSQNQPIQNNMPFKKHTRIA